MSEKVCIVTGGTSGIGQAAAKALRDLGQKVYTISRRVLPDDPMHVPADITDEESVKDAVAAILEKEHISAELIKINRLAPLDTAAVTASVKKTGVLVIAEEACRTGSVGERLVAALAEDGVLPRAVRRIDLGAGILENGPPEDLRRMTGLDAEGIARAVRDLADTDPDRFVFDPTGYGRAAHG